MSTITAELPENPITPPVHTHHPLRQLLASLLPTLSLFSLVFIAWNALSVLTESPFPMMVVVSNSMAPAIHRGDIIFVSNRAPVIKVGDIPVVWFLGRERPMMHRAVQTHWLEEGKEGGYRQKVLTKGDNNEVDDTVLYPAGQEFVDREEIVGLVKGYVPLLGWPAIWVGESSFLDWV